MKSFRIKNVKNRPFRMPLISEENETKPKKVIVSSTELDMKNQKIINLKVPTNEGDAVNLLYLSNLMNRPVDAKNHHISNVLNPFEDHHAVNKKYLDDLISKTNIIANVAEQKCIFMQSFENGKYGPGPIIKGTLNKILLNGEAIGKVHIIHKKNSGMPVKKELAKNDKESHQYSLNNIVVDFSVTFTFEVESAKPSSLSLYYRE